jgi:hypothetical protein
MLTAVFVAAALSLSSCATVDNTTNTAVWTNPHGVVKVAHYTDKGTITYNRWVPLSVREATAMLRVGRRGHKVITLCTQQPRP